MNGCLPGPHAHHRQRPLLELGDDPVGHRVEVVDEVALRRVGAVECRAVEAGELDAVAGLLRPGHQLVTSFRANRQIASTENTAA